jgi:hypothetical protein
VQGGGASSPLIFFLPTNRFFGYWVEEGQIKKQRYCQNDHLGGVKTEKEIKNFHGKQNRGI